MKENTRRLLKKLVTILAILFFLIGIALLVYPLIPEAKYELVDKNQIVIPYKSEVTEKIKEDNKGSEEKKIVVEEKKSVPNTNRIVIPSISVDMPIVEGASENSLNQGIWRIPGTGTPGKSNMVMAGHRLGYSFLPEEIRNKTSFYNLDKLKVGDYVIIYWYGKEYDYKITGGEIVEPTRIDIENPTTSPQLTLFTCDPIGTRQKRLVRYAKPI
ncbi:MAG: class E sortase [bacterium]